MIAHDSAAQTRRVSKGPLAYASGGWTRGAVMVLLLSSFQEDQFAVGQAKPHIQPDHHLPREMEREEAATYRVGQETLKATCYVPPGKGPFPALLVLHGDFGATPWVKAQARRLAKLGYVTLALDLYRGKLPKDIEEAHVLDRGLDEAKVLAELKAALDALAARPDVRKNKIGVLGFDMGGGYGLDLAIADPRVKATVLCYGRVTTDAAKLQSLQGPVLGIFAGKDAGIPKETRAQFEKAMQKAGKQLTLHIAADSDTAFLDPSSPYTQGKLNEAAVAEAWRRMETFLAEALSKTRSMPMSTRRQLARPGAV